MIDILSSLINTITGLVSFLVNSISSLMNFLIHIPTYVAFLTSAINVLPAIIIPFAIASVTISVVLFTIGR